MASNKQLMESIEANVSSIRESKFGTKLKLPSSANEEKENTKQELAYEQMIMGTLASLTWGINKLPKPGDIRNYFSHDNIFDFVKEIKQYNGSTNVLLKNILDVIKKPNNVSNDANKNTSNTLVIDFANVQNVDSITKFINSLSTNISENAFIGLSSIVELFKTLASNDVTDFAKNAAPKLTTLANVINNNKTALELILTSIKDIVGDNKLQFNITSLSSIIDTIIHILEIDSSKINISGLVMLTQITDSQNGYIAKLLNNLHESSRDINLNHDIFIVLETFFNSLVSLVDIGFVKRHRIRNNVSFIKKYIVNDIPDIIAQLDNVVLRNKETAYAAINTLTSLFTAISEVSNLNINDRIRLLLNLKFIKEVYIKEIVEILNKFQNIVNGDFASVLYALDSITKVFDMILKIGDISTFKLFKLSFKTDAMIDIIEDSIESLIDIIINIQNTDKAVTKIGDINHIFSAIQSIYGATPGLMKSVNESIKIQMIQDNIELISELVEQSNNIQGILSFNLFENQLPRLINAILSIFGDHIHRQLEETNSELIFFNENIVRNLSKTILEINKIPRLTDSKTWIDSLKTILEEFYPTVDKNDKPTLGLLVTYLPEKESLLNMLQLGVSLKNFTSTIIGFNLLDEKQKENIDKILSVTRSIVEQFNTDNEKSIAYHLSKINDNNVEKIDTIIEVLKKLSQLNKIKIVLNISEKTIKTISIIGKPIKEFVETLGSIKKEDLDKANKAINTLFKVVIGGAAILLIGSLVMGLIKPANLILFTFTLGLFLTSLGLIFWGINKGFKESMQGARNAMIIVGMGVAVMILGSWFTGKRFFANALLFAIELGIFLTTIGLVFWVVNKGFSSAFEGARNAMFIVGAAALIMIIGALSAKLYNFGDVMLFVGELSIFLLALGGIFYVIGKLFNASYKNIKKALQIVAMSALIMIGAQLIYKYLNVEHIFGFLLILGGFLIGLGLIYKAAGELMKKVLINILLCTVVTTLSAAMLLYIGSITKEHPDMLLYALLFAVGLGVFVAIMGGICYVLNRFAGQIAIGAIVMAGIMLVTLLAVGVLSYMYEVASQPDFFTTILKGLGAAAVILIGFTLLIAALGAAVLFTNGIGGALLIVGIVALAGILLMTYLTSKVLQSIAETVSILKKESLSKTDIEKMKNVVSSFIDVVNVMIDKMPWNPLKIAKLIACVFILNQASKALSSIARSLKEYSTMKFASEFDKNGKPTAWVSITNTDFDKATQNIGKIITAVLNALVQVSKDHPELFDEGLFTDSPAMQAAKVAKMMGSALGSIAKGVKDWAEMRFVEEFDEHGNPKKYASLKDSDLTRVGKNIETILTCIGKAIINTAKGNEDIFGSHWYDGILGNDSPAMNATKCIKMMGDVLKDTALAVFAYSEGLLPVYDKDGHILPRNQWLVLDKEDLEKGENSKLYKTIKLILTSLGQAIIDVVKDDDVKDLFDTSFWNRMWGGGEGMNVATAIKDMATGLSQTVDVIAKIQEMKLDTAPEKIEAVKNVLRSTISSIIGMFDIFNEERKDIIKTRDVTMSDDIVDGTVNNIKKAAGKTYNFLIGDSFIGRGIKKITGKDTHWDYRKEIKQTKANVNQYVKDHKELITETTGSIDSFLGDINSLISKIASFIRLYSENEKYFNDYQNIDIVGHVRNMLTVLKSLQDSSINIFKNVDTNQFETSQEKINTIVSLYTNTLEKISNLIKYSRENNGNYNNVLKDGIIQLIVATQNISNDANFEKYVDDIERFVNSINSIQLDKINGFMNIVSAMNNLSASIGEMDKLSDSISNKLSVVLFELVTQLRKAEATIENAHTLQDKRKQLMEESIGKMKDILNQHMIVEIYQSSDSSTSNPQTIKVNGNQVDYNNDSSSVTEDSTNTTELPNPEEKTASSTKDKDKDLDPSENGMTFMQFKEYMEYEFIKYFKD